MEWLKGVNNDLLYTRCKDYKHNAKREMAWLELSQSIEVPVKLLKQWFSVQRTLYGKLSQTRHGQGREKMTERQQWVMHNFELLKQHIKHQSILRNTLRPTVQQWLPHQPRPSTSATAMVSKSPNYESDHPDPRPGVDHTIIMHDLSAETSSTNLSTVIKKRQTFTSA